MDIIKIAFAGFRHPHIFSLYNFVNTDERFQLTGAFEENDEAKSEAENRGVKFNYFSLEDLLSDEQVNTVAVGDYYGNRGRVIINALKAGKNVISDKPLCISVDELDEIERLSDKNNLTVCLMLDLRINKNVVIAQKIIDEGRIGEIGNITFEAQHPLNYGTRPLWYFEEGKHGGTINDIGIHGIDLVRRFTHSDIISVLGAECRNFFADKEKQFKDSAQFFVRTANGTGVIADVSYAAPTDFGFSHPAYWHFRIWGRDGMLDFSPSSEGVTLYPAVGEKPLIFTDTDNIPDKYDDFIKALSDENFRKDYNKEMFASTRQTLMIQQYSDNNQKETKL